MERPTLQEDLARELAAAGLAESAIEEFDLLGISDDAEFLARECAKRVRDRVATHAQLLEELLAPDSGLAAMNECSFFSEEEHGRIVAAYRELMSILRRFTMADVEGREEAYRAFLAAAVPRWEAQRPFLGEVAARLEERWRTTQQLHGDQGYFG